MNRILFGIGATLGIAALLALAAFMHGRAATQFGDARYAQGKADEAAAQNAKITKLTVENNRLAQQLRDKTDAQITASTNHANALLLRGPGKAVCTSVGTPAPAASGHVEGDGTGAPAMGGVSGTERAGFIALPFSATLAAFAQCDANRAEVEAWRAQRQQQYDTYAKEAK